VATYRFMRKILLSFSIAFVVVFTLGLKNAGASKPVKNSPFGELKEYATYTISTTGSKNLLQVSGELMQGDKLKDGAKLGLSPKPDTIQRWQKWLLSKQANGYFTIMNLNSGKYIGVSADKNLPGAELSQSRLSNMESQYWMVTAIGNGSYKIVNKANELVITEQSGLITQQQYTNSPTQHWKLNEIEPDSYRDDAVVGFFQRTKGSTAFDEGASIPLSYGPNKGKVLWLTGDTFYDQVDEKGEFACNLIFPYHNAALIQPADHSWDPAKTVNITSPDGVQIFHTDNPKNLLWPNVGIEVGNHIYVHCFEVITGTLNTVDQYLCDITETGTTTIPKVEKIIIPNVSGQTKLQYAIGMVKPGDGYIYAYGMGGYFNSNVYVARFPADHPTQWAFWDGKNWASTPTNAPAAVLGKGPINNNTVGYVNRKYVLITMDYGFTCDVRTRNMYAAVSSSPTGPFTNRKLVYTLPDYKQGHAPVYYNPTIHAEFDNGHNELLVNYCINFYNTNDKANTTCLTPCSNPDGSEDPNDYRIKGVRIPFSLIGL